MAKLLILIFLLALGLGVLSKPDISAEDPPAGARGRSASLGTEQIKGRTLPGSATKDFSSEEVPVSSKGRSAAIRDFSSEESPAGTRGRSSSALEAQKGRLLPSSAKKDFSSEELPAKAGRTAAGAGGRGLSLDSSEEETAGHGSSLGEYGRGQGGRRVNNDDSESSEEDRPTHHGRSANALGHGSAQSGRRVHNDDDSGSSEEDRPTYHGRSASALGHGSGQAGRRVSKDGSDSSEEDQPAHHGRSASGLGHGSGQAGRRVSKDGSDSSEEDQPAHHGRSASGLGHGSGQAGRRVSKDDSDSSEEDRPVHQGRSAHARGHGLRQAGRRVDLEDSSEERSVHHGRSSRGGRQGQNSDSSEEETRHGRFFRGSGSARGAGQAGRRFTITSSEEEGMNLGNHGRTAGSGRSSRQGASSGEESSEELNAAGRSVSQGQGSGASGRRFGQSHGGSAEYKASSIRKTAVSEHSGGKNVKINKDAAVNRADGGKGITSSHTSVRNKNHAKNVEVVKKSAVNNPDGSKSSSSKLIQVDEKSKDKNIRINKHTLINSPSGSSGRSRDFSNDLDGDYSKERRPHQRRNNRRHRKRGQKKRQRYGNHYEGRNIGRESSTGSSGRGLSGKKAEKLAALVSKIGKIRHKMNTIGPKGSCVKPSPKPIDPDTTFAKITHTHRVFVPMANQEYLDLYSELLTGKKFKEGDDKFCLRLIWDPRYRRAMGHGKRVMIKCDSPGFAEVDKCRPASKSDAPTFKMTSVWTDGETSFLRIGCSPKGKGIWGVISNERNMTDELKDEILKEVAKYGFDPEEHHTLSYRSCQREIKKDILDGRCDATVKVDPKVNQEEVTKILQNQLFTVMSSQANVYANALFVRQEPLSEKEDFDSVCPHQKLHETGEFEFHGFKTKMETLECDSSDPSHIKCTPDEEDELDNDPRTYTADIHPIWSDNSNYVLVYNCLSSRHKTWALYSTDKKPVSADLKATVLAKVKEYGFDPVKSWVNNYTKCPHL